MRCTVVRVVMMLAVLTVAGAWGAVEAPEKKVTVKASELPTTIKKAIKEAFPRGKILRIEKEVQGKDSGQYDVEIRSEGKVYEVEISPAGTVIETKQISEAADDGNGGKTKAVDGGMKWTDNFQMEKRSFSATGRNRFFSLEPGHQIVIESKSEKVIIKVLDETKQIGDVVTRVVEERESEDGELVEVSRNFFAICKATGDVFYFGEEVDDYKDGKLVGHGGAWRADKKNCKAGIIMPGTVLLGARHYQEMAPNAMDRAEVIADDVTMTTPAGTFKNCIRVKETSPLEPGAICYKTYAPGIGLIQDEDLLLTAYSKGAETTVALKDLPKGAAKRLKKRAGRGKVSKIEKENLQRKGVGAFNPVVHFEIGCRDSEKTQRFYGQLFGWRIQAAGPAAMISTGSEEGIDGHITSLGHEPHQYVTVYVQVEDIQGSLDKVESLGGKTLVGPTEVPGMGHFAWFSDLDGNTIGLWKDLDRSE